MMQASVWTATGHAQFIRSRPVYTINPYNSYVYVYNVVTIIAHPISSIYIYIIR